MTDRVRNFFCQNLSMKDTAIRPISSVNITLWLSKPPSSIHGISDMTAATKRFIMYLRMSRVWTYPSTRRKAKMGKARRPTILIR